MQPRDASTQLQWSVDPHITVYKKNMDDFAGWIPFAKKNTSNDKNEKERHEISLL